ncbi:MAG: chromosome segregation protein SMC [Clostridia bacterium]|nr:chromosome segregation protein SMC [Clostridia bacterium]
MKFKKIEIYGFKSFADKIEVKFESGVTGIVGPNGCGKSNVADAIKWVMGEQSAKALRGSNMQDVIFNGTETRKRQSFCEVSLYFDNTERILPLEYDEVVFTRKLYRSGESEYLINKQPCRMKDIIDSLRDSGLGKDSYCVIGQGKIDSLLSVKPEDRRSVFEEAAGISRFKSRKIEAERKLEHTNANLIRLNDIILELEAQLGPLKEQSEKAKKFLELRDILKDLEVNIYVAQYDSASTNKEAIRNKLEALNEELEAKQQELDKVLADYDISRENIANLDAQIEGLREDLLTLTVSLEKQSGEASLIKEKLSSATAQKERLETEISQDETLEGNAKFSLEETKVDKQRNEAVSSELSRQIDKLNEEYLEVVDRITAGEKTAELSGDEIYSALEKMGDVKSSISSLNTEKSNLQDKKKEIEDRQTAIKEHKAEIDKKAEQKQGELKDVELKLDSLKSEQQSQTDLLKEINQRISDAYDRQAELNADYHSKLSRAKILEEIAEENEGYIISVKRLLEQAKTNSSIGGKIIGVVAKLMKVPQTLETAIEMALGMSVQNIVTHNEDEAKYIVSYLKQNSFGRATFLPVSSVKERFIDANNLPKLKSQGVLGIASDLISYDKSVAPVFKSLLGSTVIVDNIDNAVSLAKATRYSFKIVTLDGDVINPQGSISGGSKKEVAVSLIGRERELEETRKAIELAKKDIEQVNTQISTLKSNKENTNEKLIVLGNQIHETEVLVIRINDEISALETETDSLDAENRGLVYQLESIADKLEIIDITLAENSNKEQEINDQKTIASESKKVFATRFEELKKRREELYDSLTELKVKKASVDADISKCNENIDRLETQIANSNYRSRENKLEYQKALTMISELEGMLASFVQTDKQLEIQQKIDQIRQRLSQMDEEKATLQMTMNSADAKKMELSLDIQRSSEKRTKEEMNLAKIDTDIETMQERVWEEYSLTYADAVLLKRDDFVLTEGLTESSKIKKEINNLGYVNVAAIEDVKSVSERYDDLCLQRDDLTKTQDDLIKIIKELSQQMEAKFKEQFEKINQNFKQTFKELFGGGRAELLLQEDVSCLEAGIDIIAEPPGKKLQNINLLSGGEKAFTAVAILFAILKLRPMPFCVLDEIEAALDDANVERFAKYLKRFSESTQFIVITHRKPTMELADCLYGVTMEEKGVSKMVSVKLSDAVKNSTEGA